MRNPFASELSSDVWPVGKSTKTKVAARTKMSAAALAIVAGSALAACGDRITANRDWYSTPSITSQVRSADGRIEQTLILDGLLATSKTGTVVPGTSFHLDCVQFDDHLGHNPYNCLMLVNAGQKVYVASARQDKVLSSELPHQLNTLTDPEGSLSYTVLGIGTKSVHLKISARRH